MAQPTYEHDCTACEYLGTVASKWEDGSVADLYYCGKSAVDTCLIARYGDEGPNYSSCPSRGIAQLTGNPDLMNAYKRWSDKTKG